MSELTLETFASRLHPGEASATAVWGRAIGGKLAVLVVALFTIVAGLALLHRPIGAALGWGAGLGLVAAWYLTRLQLERRAVEIRVAGPYAAVRTALDVAARRAAPLTPVIDLRRGEPITTLTLGDDVWELDDDDWPELGPLLAALSTARRTAHAA